MNRSIQNSSQPHLMRSSHIHTRNQEENMFSNNQSLVFKQSEEAAEHSYEELKANFISMRRRQATEKSRLLEAIQNKAEKLRQMKAQKERLEEQRNQIASNIAQQEGKLQQVRMRNRRLQQSYDEYRRMLQSEYVSQIMMSLQYQNGLDIDVDRMTYEQLLQLQQKIGVVSRGLKQEQVQRLPKTQFVKTNESQSCIVCCQELQDGQEIVRLQCRHLFHFVCIKDWLLKERTCPTCKKEVTVVNESLENQPQNDQGTEINRESA